MSPEGAPAVPGEGIYRQYLDALVKGHKVDCQQAVDRWLEGNRDLRSLYEGLFRRSLYEIGVLWQRGRVSVATEHLATALTEFLMAKNYSRCAGGTVVKKSVLAACTTGEFHQLGAKMVADFFESHGWRCYFVGGQTSISNLLELISKNNIDVVTLSLTLSVNRDVLFRMTKQIHEAVPFIPILVGGQGFLPGDAEYFESLSGVRHLDSLAELEAWIEAGGEHGR